MLVEHARRLKGRLSVEVNEQNAEAVRFYRACGFPVTGRSELDRGGRPFPLLLMEEQPDGHREAEDQQTRMAKPSA